MATPRAGDERLTPSPQLSEIGWAAQSFFANNSGPFEAFNPDILLRNRGVDVYRRMRRDPQVKAVYNLVTDIILSRAYRFIRPDDSEKQREIEEFLNFNFKSFVRGSFLDGMKTILSSKAHGYSVTEKIWQSSEWRGKERWFLRALKPKPFHTFTFETDQYGNLRKLIQQRPDGRRSLKPNKFVVHVTNPDMDDLYGESDLKAAYRPFWEKDIIAKMWDIYLERYAAGFLIMKPGAPLQAPERAKAQAMLENVSALSGFLLPPNVELEMIQGTPSDVFERAILHKNTEIAKALLVPNLLGLSEQGRAGSFAQSKVQQETFFLAILRQGDSLAETINEQIVRDLVWWNFGVKEAPRFVFDPFTNEHKQDIVGSWITAVEKGVVVNTMRDELRTRNLLGYEEREEDEKPIIVPKPDPTPDPEPDIVASESVRFFQEGETEPNMEALGASLDNIEQRSAVRINDALDQATADMIAAMIEFYPKIDKEDSEGTAKFAAQLEKSISPAVRSRVNKSWQTHLRESYRRGRKFALEAIQVSAKKVGNKDVLKRSRQVAREGGIALSAGEMRPITPMQFVDGLDTVTAEEYFAGRAFWLTGEQIQDIIAAGQQAILDGLRDELTITEMIARLEPILAPLIGERDAAGNRINIGARLETIIRTNLTDAFTQAQLSVYNDPDLEDFVPALKYSAIIDSRTTQFCRDHNDKTYLREDPIWATITPPNHFNCRSVLIPVIDGQSFTVSNRLSVQPSSGFGGPPNNRA